MNHPQFALSIRQPWAWAIIYAGKDVENRDWKGFPAKHVGQRIAIHAAKGMTQAEYADAADFMMRMGVVCPAPFALARGAIIGSVTFTGVVGASASLWFTGPTGLILKKPMRSDPIPAVGQLGFFKWEPAPLDAKPTEPLPWMLKEIAR